MRHQMVGLSNNLETLGAIRLAELRCCCLLGIQERPAICTNSASVTLERSTTPLLPSEASKAKSDTSPHRATLPWIATLTSFLSSSVAFGLSVRFERMPGPASESDPRNSPGRISVPRRAEPPHVKAYPPDWTRPHSVGRARPRLLSPSGKRRRARTLHQTPGLSHGSVQETQVP